MANSKYGQGHKDKYIDTSRKILSREMLMCNMKALMFLIYKLWPKSILKKIGQMSRTIGLIPTEGIFIRNMESLISKIFYSKTTVEKLLHCSKVKTPRSWSQGQKCWYLRNGLVTRNTSVKYESSSTHSSKVISKVKMGQTPKIKVTW